jgi:hypothetical protein
MQVLIPGKNEVTHTLRIERHYTDLRIFCFKKYGERVIKSVLSLRPSVVIFHS